MSNCIDCSEEELYLNNEPILDGEQSEQEIHLKDEPICDGVLSDQEIQLEIEPILAGGTKDHSKLNNLDYENAGHIGFQQELISGENIKTINNESILGSGNIDVQTEDIAWGNISGEITDQTDLQQEFSKYTPTTSLATVATSGDYGDLLNTPTIPTVNNATLTIQKNSTNIGTFTANASSNETINITVPVSASDVSALPSSTKYGASLSLSIDSSTYVLTAQLKDQDNNNLGSAQTVDLPLESVVVNGSYDSTNKQIVLTLQNGNIVNIPVGDLVAGLQTEITSNNMLSADLVDDSTTTNKFVTASDITEWNGKQNALTAGSNISISNNTISATDTTYSAGAGLTLSGTEFSVDTTTIQSKLTPGSNITISGDTISATDTTYSDATTSASGLMSATDKVKLGNVSGYYGTSSTAAGTAAKVVTCSDFVLGTGTIIYVKFTNANSYNGTATLNVNGTGAIDIARVGTTKTTRYYWSAGEVVGFVYDGTNYVMMERGTASTTYYGLTKLSSSATSTSEALSLTPKALNSFAQGVVANYPAYSSSSTYAVGDRVRYSYGIYECNTAITTAESWTAAHWTAVKTLQEQIDDVDSSIPTVNNSTITVQMNGSTVGSFTTNASSNKTINLGTVITNVSGKEDKSNKVTTISSSSTDAQYPSAKAVYTAISQENMPSYVVQEAESVITKALSHNITGRTIRFIAASDAHNDATGMATVTADADSQLNPELTRNIQQSNQHCGMAMKYISDRLGVDFIAYLGDATWAGVQGRPYSQPILKADLEQMSGFLNFGARGVNQIRCVGNHDEMLTQSDSKRLQNVGAYDFYGRFCVGNKINPAGYGYYDIDSSNMRVIYLNTSDTVSDLNAGTKIQMTQEQINWLCETLIDTGDKTGWKCIVLSHVPLDMFTFNNTYIADILKTYTNGGTYGGYNFSGHNSTPILANVHGHVHCYRVDYMSNKIRRFAIPNCCYTDNNHYYGRAGYEAWCEDVTYNKTPNSAQDTSFSLVTIDLDNNYCYVDNYGAGYDRNFSLDYKSSKYPTGISNVNYSGTTTVGANIDVNAFTYTITYSDTSTESKSSPVTVSPVTIQQVGSNTVRVTYTEDIYSVYTDITIVGTAAPVVNLLNMNRTYDVLATGTNISNALSESVAYKNILYSTSNGYAKSCTVNSYTADSLSMKESGDSSICVAYAIHIPDTSKDIRVTFDYDGPNACRVFRSYADSTNLRTWAGALIYQDNTAGASGSADVTLEKASTAVGAGYDWLILMFSSNGGGSKNYSNVVVQQVNS